LGLAIIKLIYHLNFTLSAVSLRQLLFEAARVNSICTVLHAKGHGRGKNIGNVATVQLFALCLRLGYIDETSTSNNPLSIEQKPLSLSCHA